MSTARWTPWGPTALGRFTKPAQGRRSHAVDDSGWKGRSLRGNEKTRPPKTEPRDQGSHPQASPSALCPASSSPLFLSPLPWSPLQAYPLGRCQGEPEPLSETWGWESVLHTGPVTAPGSPWAPVAPCHVGFLSSVRGFLLLLGRYRSLLVNQHVLLATLFPLTRAEEMERPRFPSPPAAHTAGSHHPATSLPSAPRIPSDPT